MLIDYKKYYPQEEKDRTQANAEDENSAIVLKLHCGTV